MRLDATGCRGELRSSKLCAHTDQLVAWLGEGWLVRLLHMQVVTELHAVH
jgi:hypothetical protein